MSRTWIDKHLGLKERTALVDWLLERSQNPTGETILSGLQELFPAFEDYPSLNSILTWKKNAWRFELHKRELKEDSEAAAVLSQVGDGSRLDEANRVMLQSMIFQQLRALKEGRMENVDADLLNALAKNVSVLARQGMAERELQVKLEKLEAERKQLEANVKQVATDDNLTPEQRLEKIRKGLKV